MRGLRVSRTINANIQNQINTSIIFHYISDHEPVYRAKIAESLGISAPAVSRVIESLIADGFVFESGVAPTERGRKAAELRINTRRGMVVAADLIKERTRMAACDYRGRIVERFSGFRFSEASQLGPELMAGIDHLLAARRRPGAGETGPQLGAIAVGIPAAMGGGPGSPRISTSLYPGLEGLDIAQTLGSRYGVPVYVENVVKLSALAEMNEGVARGHSDLVFVEVSNGIGAGIIVDGHVYRGANGASGELGFTLLGNESLAYHPSNKGWLEDRASMEGITRRAAAAMNGHATALRRLCENDADRLTPSMVCQAALEGDGVALGVVKETVESLSVAIINLVLILNPQVVVLGGDLCRLPGLEELFVAPLRANARSSIPFAAPPIAVSALGEDAGILGASRLAVDSLLMNRFPYRLSASPP